MSSPQHLYGSSSNSRPIVTKLSAQWGTASPQNAASSRARRGPYCWKIPGALFLQMRSANSLGAELPCCGLARSGGCRSNISPEALDGSRCTTNPPQTKAIKYSKAKRSWKLQLLQWSVLYKWLLYNIISNCSFTYSLESFVHEYNPSALNGLRVKLAVSDVMGVAEYQ